VLPKVEPNLYFSEPAILKYLDIGEQHLDEIVSLRRLFKYYRRVNLLMFSTLNDLIGYLDRVVPAWAIATYNENNILILDYQLWKARQVGPFTQIILHELVHVIVSSLAVKVPLWLNEGLAQYLAGQLDMVPIISEKIATTNIYDLNHEHKYLYDLSGWMVANLINTYGLAAVISRIPQVVDFRSDAIFGEKNINGLYTTRFKE
jgi:hypothetical protein